MWTVATLAGLGQENLEAPFTRVSDGAIATDEARSNTAAWGDYDNDGWLDLFVGHNGAEETDVLYHNHRDGTFQRVTSTVVSESLAGQTHASAWIDYNNDGALDLFVATLTSVPNRLYRGDGHGGFTLMTEEDIGVLASDVGNSVGASWADWDRDGHLDLFVPNGALVYDQADFLFRNLGNGRFERVLQSPIAKPQLSSTQGSWADYDNDGDPDLFVTHSQDEGNSLFRNDGPQGFIQVAAAAGVGFRGDSSGAAWGDYDNDGHLDLFVTNIRLGQAATRNYLFHNQGNGTFQRLTNNVLTADTGHFTSGTWVDFDNDGLLDLFVAVDSSPGPGYNRLYRNLGSGNFVRITGGALVTDAANAGGCAWGDYNNDGFPDVIVANGTIHSAQRNGLYRNNGNTNGWLKLKCVGTQSNRSAIGTRIRVKATISGHEVWQLRQIAGSEGWLSFNALEAIFGLGNAPMAEVVHIEWPSGGVQELRNIPARQALTVVEQTPPRLLVERTPNGGLSLSWSSAEPADILEFTPSLSPLSWEPFPAASGAGTPIPLDASVMGMFRLRRP
ncbi:MAG: CRTAC1 family protein [Verrucomicrobiales bacterium]|nr:CRTAC1 family protein [Verrucomicrobiales bacterium]